MIEEKEEKHESYATMGFSRVQCSENMQLFGSDLGHATLIKMEVSHASKKRGLNRNWYHAKDKIIELYMSQNQFSEMITSLNIGDGIPVTLQMTERDGRISQPKTESISRLHETEFKDQMKAVGDSARHMMDNTKKLFAGTGVLKKADRESIIKSIERVVQEIESNMPYVENCFKKSMDDVVTDAKATIEAFYQSRVTDAGLKALQNGPIKPKLLDNKD